MNGHPSLTMMRSKRLPNFSFRETRILLNLVYKYKQTVDCKKTDKNSNYAKAEAWEKITNEFNSMCGKRSLRNSKMLRIRYDNLKKRLKQKFRDQNLYDQLTETDFDKKDQIDVLLEKLSYVINTRKEECEYEFGEDSNTAQNHEEAYSSDMEREVPVEYEYVLESDDEFLVKEELPLSEETATSSQVLCNKTPIVSENPKPKEHRPKILKAPCQEIVEGPRQRNLEGGNSHGESSQKQDLYAEKEHSFKLQLMQERHEVQMELERTILKKAQIEIRHMEEEHQLKMFMMRELHSLQVEKERQKK